MTSVIQTPRPLPSSDIQLDVNERVTPEIVNFFERTLWGTEGALYRLRDYAESLEHIPNTRFLGLRKQGRLLALRILNEKYIAWQKEPLQAFYHGLLCVDEKVQNQGYGKMLVERTLDYIRERAESKHLIYSFIEAGNQRSFRIAESLGYQKVGTFHATFFSRLHPRASKRAALLNAPEQSTVLKSLESQYRNHTLTDFPLSLQTSSYHILKEGRQILAGAQFEYQRWIFESLGGTGGYMAVKILPYLPVLGSLFNPQDFRFLKVGNLFFQRAQAQAATELLEAVLEQSKLKVALLFLDKKSPAYQEWLGRGGVGLLNALAEVEVHVMARFQGFTSPEIEEFKRQPLIISPIDL
jgi:RimJ/RimL family protein N-acetyltransferase